MKDGLRKKDSLLIYGIAILMMIYHHLFSNPARLGDYEYISILNILSGNNAEQRLAWLFRLCVPFYAFISGYGLCTIISRKKAEERCKIGFVRENYKLVFLQILKLMKKYWIVFAVFVPMRIILKKGTLINLKTFLMALLGLDSSYNAEWWYVKQYIMMVCLFPVFDFFVCNIYCWIKKKIIERFIYGRQMMMIGLGILGVLCVYFRNTEIFRYFISQLDNGRFVFTLVFFVGFLCSFFHIFEIGYKNEYFQKFRPMIAILLIAGCIGIRWIRAYDAVYCKYDAFITAPIIYSICTLFSYFKSLSSLFQKIGKYSTYMWLTHTFFCFYYFNHFILMAKVSILMFFLLVIISLLTAILFTNVERRLNKVFHLTN